MTISVRRATGNDAEAISRVLIASITELCSADHKHDPEAIAAWTRNKSVVGTREMLANPALNVFVAERSGQILGVGATTHGGGIALNYVAPEARFSGVSKALLAHMETDLTQQGHELARLEATATAKPFYEARGWRDDGPQATGRRVNGYPMVKAIK